MKANQLKELIRQVVKEENDYQEMFKAMLDKTGKSIASMSDTEKKAFFNAVDKAAKAKSEGKLRGYNENLPGNQEKLDTDKDGNFVMNENRWLELKKDESTAQAKIGRGISTISRQLKEMERFLNWYGKIKNESGVDNKSYWKRTNSHIYSIKERLLKLDQKIRQISE